MFTESQLQILAAMFNRPDQEYYLSQLGRLLGKPPGVFQRTINLLEKQNIVTSRKDGNRRLFILNIQHPFFQEFRNMIRKTHGAEGLLGRVIQGMKKIRLALIYGSYAQNKLRPGSDIDVLIVADDPGLEGELLKRLPRIERKLQREINYKLYTAADFKRRRKTGDPFLKRVLSSRHIVLKGSL